MNKFTQSLLIGAALLAPAVLLAADSGHKFIVSPSTTQPPLPFSDAVIAGNTLYVSGTLGIDSKTGQVASTPTSEATAVMDAVKHTIESAGFKMEDVVVVQVFCTDLQLYSGFNEVYRTYFHDHFPTRAFIGAAQLVRGAHFEVMATAVKSSP